MDPANYYITTLTNAFHKLGPIVAFIVVGYFVFIKLPFLFLKKSMQEQKKGLKTEPKDDQIKIEVKQEAPKLKVLNKPESKKKEEPKQQQNQQQQKKQEPKKPVFKPASEPTPEEILGFKPGEAFTQIELKKRYFELLKQNHPDRVASMGDDFKKLAEKNTKDINKAYEKLKKSNAA